jgi:deoxycytidylate deaminase
MLNRIDIACLKVAREESFKSHDKTKIGSIIVNTNWKLLSQGHNHLPKYFLEDTLKYYLADRELKNKFIIHSEVDAILKSTLNPNDFNIMYVWGLFPCSRCAGIIANNGSIKRVIAVDAVSTPNKDMWSDEAKLGREIFNYCGIVHSYLTLEEFSNELKYHKMTWDYMNVI